MTDLPDAIMLEEASSQLVTSAALLTKACLQNPCWHAIALHPAVLGTAFVLTLCSVYCHRRIFLQVFCFFNKTIEIIDFFYV